MTASQRNIGGINHRKGNRSENAFAVFRCLELATKVLTEGTLITLEERPSSLSWQTLSDGSASRHAPAVRAALFRGKIAANADADDDDD